MLLLSDPVGADRDRAGQRHHGRCESALVYTRPSQQRVELIERDAEAAGRTRWAAEQSSDGIALRRSRRPLDDRAVQGLSKLHPPPRSVEHPGQIGVAQQPIQPLEVDASHSCGPSGELTAAPTGKGSTAGSTRTRAAPSHSQRVTSTAATPSIRESCAIASPGTSA